MEDINEKTGSGARGFLQDPQTRRVLAGSAILAAGLILGGYLLGDGLKRARDADRSVTVRGLAEREVTADLATWTISFSSTDPQLSSAQAEIGRDTEVIRTFFRDLGFPADELQPSGVNVSQFTNDGITKFTVRQRLTLRTRDVERAQDAVRKQFDLVRQGVVLEDGSNMSYTFTKLNDIKPEMVAQATRDARSAADQFAEDSGATVGSIKTATQGYFSIEARDGEAGGWGISDTPFKKVRVVTTVVFDLR